MIPKIIHYCWFGGKEMPPLARQCMDSWKKQLPDYEIKLWNEDSFDLDLFPYAREAYDNRRYAFVTDVVRLYALYHYGGVYMDTDVEGLKSLDPFLHHHAFSGFENETDVPTGIMASAKGGRWAKENLEYYHDRHFVLPDGELDLTTNVVSITSYMLKHGLERNNTYQDIPGLITMYPRDYFCPLTYGKTQSFFTDRTVTIHHFAGSWLSPVERFRKNHPVLMRRWHAVRKFLGFPVEMPVDK